MIDDIFKGAAALVAGGAIMFYAEKALAEPNLKALDSIAQRFISAGYVIHNTYNGALLEYMVDTMEVHAIVLRKIDNLSIGRPTVVVEMYKGEADQWENNYWDKIMPDSLRERYGRVTVKNAPDEVSDGLYNAVQNALSGTGPTTGFDGKNGTVVGTERSSWGAIKSLYNSQQKANWSRLRQNH